MITASANINCPGELIVESVIMWFSVAILNVAFLASNALNTLVQFRLPNEDLDYSPNGNSNDLTPVSLFYVDEYTSGGVVSQLDVSIPELLRTYPCLLMEPAYSRVRDQMTLYGTCNYQSMFRLDLQRSDEQWTAKVKLSNKNCRDDLVDNFELNWHGINHTVVSRKTDRFYGSVTLDLLPYKTGMSYDTVRSMYPVLNNTNFKLLRKSFNLCKCLDGSEFEFKNTWKEFCPESYLQQILKWFKIKLNSVNV